MDICDIYCAGNHFDDNQASPFKAYRCLSEIEGYEALFGSTDNPSLLD